MVSAHGIEKSYGDRTILGGVSVTLEAGDRVGLIGANGSGKTTLAKILAGVLEPDSGEIRQSRGSRHGYLTQEPVMEPNSTALEVVLGGLEEYVEALSRYETVAVSLESADDDVRDRLLAEQGELGEVVERLGGWDLRHRASGVLGHLGLPDPSRLVGTMSGGERRRVALARILVAEPELAILDEPTNHLDIPTIEWLERYLVDHYRGALLLITHDRYLLDRVVRRTIEVERGTLHSYSGAWQEYLEARASREAHAARAEANRANFLRRELEWVRRQPKARTTKSKSRMARAHEALETTVARDAGPATISATATRSGKTILEARDLCLEIGGQRLVDGLTVSLSAGQRIGVIGANGAGKTTLLRGLLGELEPVSGSARLGANTRVAYLDQTRAGLNGDASVYDNVAQGASHVTVGDRDIEVRAYLYRFLFDNSSQKQVVRTLSGGERARVALAKVLRQKANLVVLDEPTNDLDATTLSALEESLLEFPGTSIVVTHDRWFLDRVATHLLTFEENGEIVFHAGNYSDYVEWKAAHGNELAASDEPPPPKSGPSNPASSAVSNAARDGAKKLTYGEQIELDGLMAKVEAAEGEVARLEAQVNGAEFATTGYQRQATILAELETARGEAESLVERWSELEARSCE